MQIPNYETKVDRIMDKAIHSCIASPGIKIVIVTKWMAGMHLFWKVGSKALALDSDAVRWHEGKRVIFKNGSQLFVMDSQEDWIEYENQIDVAYVVCDMWEIDPITRMNMGKALVLGHSEIHRIRYPSIILPRYASLRGITSSMVWIDDDF